MKRLMQLVTSAALSIALVGCTSDDEALKPGPNGVLQALTAFGEPTTIPPDYTLEDLRHHNALIVESGPVAYVIGYRMDADHNAYPVLAKYEGEILAWERSDYDNTADDSHGYGLLWDGSATVYAVFSTMGHQGLASEDYRRFAAQGWLSSYGQGEGKKAAVVARIDAGSGDITHATYLRSQLEDGSTNALTVHHMELRNNAYVRIFADADHNPLQPNRQPMSCTGQAPFAYSIALSPHLSLAEEAEAEGCGQR